MVKRSACYVGLLLLVAGWLTSCQKEAAPLSAWETQPMFAHHFYFLDDSDTLIPTRIQIFEDTLFVAFKDKPFIGRYSLMLQDLGRIDLIDQQPVAPTEFEVTDSLIVVISHADGMVILYQRDGTLVTSFGTQPDGQTPLMPFSLDCYGGVAYVGDLAMHRVMAVSITNVGNLTEIGELILTIPGDTTHAIGFPASILVTWDGRLVAADANDGLIKVFTCDGRYVYNFDTLPSGDTMAVQGMAYDEVSNPALIDSTVFDPSGLPQHGRIHVTDSKNGQMIMFSSLGKFIATYGDEGALIRPTDVVVNTADNQILVADPARQALTIFSYRDGR